MIMLNTFNLEDEKSNLGLQGLTLEDLKKRVNIPLGIYLGCPGENKTSENIIYDAAGMLATDEHLLRAKEIGADFIVLGGNPGSGTSIQDIIETTKRARKLLGNDVLIFAGKWEDGIDEKVLGDPLAKQDAKEVIKQLIDAGADVIDLPAPGSRHGISVRMIQELVQFIHLYKPGTLAMTFLNSSVEGADQDTIRLIALMMKKPVPIFTRLVMVVFLAVRHRKMLCNYLFHLKENLIRTLEWQAEIVKTIKRSEKNGLSKTS